MTSGIVVLRTFTSTQTHTNSHFSSSIILQRWCYHPRFLSVKRSKELSSNLPRFTQSLSPRTQTHHLISWPHRFILLNGWLTMTSIKGIRPTSEISPFLHSNLGHYCFLMVSRASLPLVTTRGIFTFTGVACATISWCARQILIFQMVPLLKWTPV